VKPTGSTVTINGAILKGATSLTVDALTETIEAGNWLMFTDTDGLEYLAKVSATADPTDTTITVSAVSQAIPDNATAKFPPELFDRSEVSVETSVNTQNVLSLNTGGTELQVATTTSNSLSSPGYWHWWNPGLRIAEEQAIAKNPFWIIVEYESPDPEIFAKGQVLYGKGLITGLPKASPAEGFVSMDLSFVFSGVVTTVAPVAVA
jgi:hypothetical protein